MRRKGVGVVRRFRYASYSATVSTLSCSESRKTFRSQMIVVFFPSFRLSVFSSFRVFQDSIIFNLRTLFRTFFLLESVFLFSFLVF